MSLITEVIDELNIHSTEGERGIKNLAVLCRALGYEDFQRYGQFNHNGLSAAHGDIFTMLEDNPCVIEAIIRELGKHLSDEQKESLECYLTEDDE